MESGVVVPDEPRWEEVLARHMRVAKCVGDLLNHIGTRDDALSTAQRLSPTRLTLPLRLRRLQDTSTEPSTQSSSLIVSTVYCLDPVSAPVRIPIHPAGASPDALTHSPQHRQRTGLSRNGRLRHAHNTDSPRLTALLDFLPSTLSPMTTPASSVTSASPPLPFHFHMPAHSLPSASPVPSIPSIDLDAMDTDADERQKAIQKILASAELSLCARGLRARLAYASFKAARNITHAQLPDLEAKTRPLAHANHAAILNAASAVPHPQGTPRGAKRKAPSAAADHYSSPSTTHRGNAMAPPVSSRLHNQRSPRASASTGAHPSPTAPASSNGNPGQSLFAALLGPPPLKQARTVHNSSDPPVAPAARTAGDNRARRHSRASEHGHGRPVRSIAEGTRAQSRSRREEERRGTTRTGKGAKGRHSHGHGHGAATHAHGHGHHAHSRSAHAALPSSSTAPAHAHHSHYPGVGGGGGPGETGPRPREDAEIERNAVQTLTHLLHARPSASAASVGATSPRSTLSAHSASGSGGSDVGSMYAQSSARTGAGPGPGATATATPTAAPAALPLTASANARTTPPPRSQGAAHMRTPSLSSVSGGSFPAHLAAPGSQHQATPRADDEEAANLMLWLHTSPSPARPGASSSSRERAGSNASTASGAYDKDAMQDRVAFRALGGGAGPASLKSAGRVLFADGGPHASRGEASAGKTRGGAGEGARSSLKREPTELIPGSSGSQERSSAGSTATSHTLSTVASGPGGAGSALGLGLGLLAPALPVPGEPNVIPPTPIEPSAPAPSFLRSPPRAAKAEPGSPVRSASSSSSSPRSQAHGGGAAGSGTGPTAPPTPSASFNLSEYINVSPSPAAASRAKSGAASGLRADVGRRLFEEHHQHPHPHPHHAHHGHGHGHGHGREGSGALGAGIDLRS